jgi:ABC-type lipoprotein export system ATPase subunit
MPPVLAFRNVSKSYDNRIQALDNVSFEVTAGQSVAIIGRSGSGKSTLLHLAGGIDTASSGTVELLGRDMSRADEHQRTSLRRDHVGLVFQFFHLLTHLSAIENVLLPSLIARDNGREARTRALELLERVGLSHRSGDNVQELSGGERQRIAVCRALLRKPTLLLADEPTGNLDDDSGRDVMELMLHLAREEARTLIYVTHSPEMARMADTVWHLHSGHLETA